MESFYKYINNRRKPRENVGLLLNGAEDLVIKDMEKVKVLNATFTLNFTGNTGLLQSQVFEAHGKI